MKTLLLIAALAPMSLLASAQIDSAQLFIDSLEASFDYQQGQIELRNSIGTLDVPERFRYLNSEQSRFVLEQLWGNPEDSTVLGMIVPSKGGLLADDSWAFIITFEELGYVEDGDAGEIDYDELLDEMKADASAANAYRVGEGYDPIEIVGWASKPFYDEKKKVLHWAKEIKFGDSPFNTLNYNVRVLGRKGVLVLNAVSPMEELAAVQESITPVLSSFTYADGAKYSDFDPNVDEVAAWTIGGLVAGKVLAKAGFFALFLKYIKFIIVGVGAIATAIWKWYQRKTTLPDVRNLQDSAKA